MQKIMQIRQESMFINKKGTTQENMHKNLQKTKQKLCKEKQQGTTQESV